MTIYFPESALALLQQFSTELTWDAQATRQQVNDCIKVLHRFTPLHGESHLQTMHRISQTLCNKDNLQAVTKATNIALRILQQPYADRYPSSHQVFSEARSLLLDCKHRKHVFEERMKRLESQLNILCRTTGHKCESRVQIFSKKVAPWFSLDTRTKMAYLSSLQRHLERLVADRPPVTEAIPALTQTYALRKHSRFLALENLDEMPTATQLAGLPMPDRRSCEDSLFAISFVMPSRHLPRMLAAALPEGPLQLIELGARSGWFAQFLAQTLAPERSASVQIRAFDIDGLHGPSYYRVERNNGLGALAEGATPKVTRLLVLAWQPESIVTPAIATFRASGGEWLLYAGENTKNCADFDEIDRMPSLQYVWDDNSGIWLCGPISTLEQLETGDLC